MYVTRGLEVGHPTCLQMRTQVERRITLYVNLRTYTIFFYVFSCFFMFFHVFILHRYSQTLFYIIVIVVVTVTVIVAAGF